MHEEYRRLFTELFNRPDQESKDWAERVQALPVDLATKISLLRVILAIKKGAFTPQELVAKCQELQQLVCQFAAHAKEQEAKQESFAA